MRLALGSSNEATTAVTGSHPRTRTIRACAAAILAVLSCASTAQAQCDPVADAARGPGTISMRADNDAFGGDGQDHGYTHGLQLTYRTGNLQGVRDPACLPLLTGGVHRVVHGLHADGFDQINALFSLSHGVFTPVDHEATGLIVNDRPYAAIALLGVGYNARRRDSLISSQLRVGMVGPAAMGERVQNSLHKIIGAHRYQGWSHQLRNEPVVQVLHERMRRVDLPPTVFGLDADVIGRWGGSLGNLATYANAGGEWRIGRQLLDDFGSEPVGPAGESVAPVGGAPGYGLRAWHLSLSLDVRAVAHNLTLDGNTWKDSHGVAKRRWVADFGQGVTLMHGAWKFVLMRTVRTREFMLQQHRPVFGSITVTRQL
jgi:hypothetical protein